MQVTIDVRHPTPQTARSAAASRGWSVGPTAADDGQPMWPGAQPYSYLSDCECPDDCLRDHENE